MAKGTVKIKDHGPWVSDESNRGELSLRTNCIVMDNNISRNQKHMNKKKVSYFITENSSLFEGSNTVALFRIKERRYGSSNVPTLL